MGAASLLAVPVIQHVGSAGVTARVEFLPFAAARVPRCHRVYDRIRVHKPRTNRAHGLRHDSRLSRARWEPNPMATHRSGSPEKDSR